MNGLLGVEDTTPARAAPTHTTHPKRRKAEPVESGGGSSAHYPVRETVRETRSAFVRAGGGRISKYLWPEMYLKRDACTRANVDTSMGQTWRYVSLCGGAVKVSCPPRGRERSVFLRHFRNTQDLQLLISAISFTALDRLSSRPTSSLTSCVRCGAVRRRRHGGDRKATSDVREHA